MLRKRALEGESILEQIGGTPLVRIRNLAKKVAPVEIYAKAEWFNPGGSVKDRPALWMIEEGESNGKLTREKIILDATSGNTGIAYAMIGAVKGYRVTLVMPANVSKERVLTVKAYGAEMILTDPMTGTDGAQLKVSELMKKEPDKYFVPGQYANEANPRAHYETTGIEIYEQTGGKVTHFVAGIGTSGTVMGTGRRLKEFNPKIQVVAAEPENGLHGLEGLKHMATSIVPTIYHEEELDQKISVPTEEAYKIAERLSKEEGLLVGHSSGAALWAALQVAHDLKEGVIVTIFPDRGDRYFSAT
ncbi:MAG: cysteine synthase family protein [Deltaproteobacteria bacterium]|nr:cysteine synthase family protein [Deltaproteobacteria bacterium]